MARDNSKNIVTKQKPLMGCKWCCNLRSVRRKTLIEDNHFIPQVRMTIIDHLFSTPIKHVKTAQNYFLMYNNSILAYPSPIAQWKSGGKESEQTWKLPANAYICKASAMIPFSSWSKTMSSNTETITMKKELYQTKIRWIL